MTKPTDIVNTIQRQVRAYVTITGQVPTTLYIDKKSYYILEDALRIPVRSYLIHDTEQPMYQGMAVYKVDTNVPHIKVTHS